MSSFILRKSNTYDYYFDTHEYTCSFILQLYLYGKIPSPKANDINTHAFEHKKQPHLK